MVEKDSLIFQSTKIVQNTDCHLAYQKSESGSQNITCLKSLLETCGKSETDFEQIN